MKSNNEIKSKIEELVGDDENFTTNNFGSFEANNGNYYVNYSEFNTKETLVNFANWLLEKN